jgi:hypothetical protein
MSGGEPLAYNACNLTQCRVSGTRVRLSTGVSGSPPGALALDGAFLQSLLRHRARRLSRKADRLVIAVPLKRLVPRLQDCSFQRLHALFLWRL